MIIAIVGAGGKTTLLKQKAQEYRTQGKKVFVTTSTRMFIEPDTLLTDDADEIIKKLDSDGYVMAGLKDGIKLAPLSPETFQKVSAYADITLVEADGSKHMPIKFPNKTEPVIYDHTDEIIVVCGLHALGKPAHEVCHRLELVKQCLNIADDTIITPEHVQKLVMEGYMIPLKKAYPNAVITVYPAHDGSASQKAAAQWLLETVH